MVLWLSTTTAVEYMFFKLPNGVPYLVQSARIKLNNPAGSFSTVANS